MIALGELMASQLKNMHVQQVSRCDDEQLAALLRARLAEVGMTGAESTWN